VRLGKSRGGDRWTHASEDLAQYEAQGLGRGPKRSHAGWSTDYEGALAGLCHAVPSSVQHEGLDVPSAQRPAKPSLLQERETSRFFTFGGLPCLAISFLTRSKKVAPWGSTSLGDAAGAALPGSRRPASRHRKTVPVMGSKCTTADVSSCPADGCPPL